jgi:hypothetical protein
MEMLEQYKTGYKSAPRDATHLEPGQLGILKGEVPVPAGSGDGSEKN